MESSPQHKISKGTILWKVRGYDKWFRREYRVDLENNCIRYEPSHKPFKSDVAKKINLKDVIEVRRGWKTDTFNKIGKKLDTSTKDHGLKREVVDEKKCFSILYGKGKCLDLVASSEEECNDWIDGLQSLIKESSSGGHLELKHKWLRYQFEIADKDDSGVLTFDECLELFKRLNIAISKSHAKTIFQDANVSTTAPNGEKGLTKEELIKCYEFFSKRQEVTELFEKYSPSKIRMTADQFKDMLVNEQKITNVTSSDCEEIIKKIEPTECGAHGLLSLDGFQLLISSELFDIFNYEHKEIYQDMEQPLSHYYIASSHNTYLTSHQLAGQSSVEGYIQALLKGCRCVEMDCWDGPTGEPIIYHGYTLTTKILFKDVLQDAIKPYAFSKTSYPLILSLEMHCTVEQQVKIAQHLEKILGDMLYKCNTEGMKVLPSPKALMNKILIKAKKRPIDVELSESDSDEEDQEERKDPDKPKVKSKVVSSQLSDLVNIIQAVHFHGFEHAESESQCYHMSSFGEKKADKFITKSRKDFINYNSRQLSRIYPAGSRTGSTNFKPMKFWNVGCQIVALNYQSSGKPTTLNSAMFSDNGCCGYILKPWHLRGLDYEQDSEFKNITSQTITIKVISGQCLPKPGMTKEGEVIDPYVVVWSDGHQVDADQKFKTKVVKNNGFNPTWNETGRFTYKIPDAGFLMFTVKDQSNSGANEVIGSFGLPVKSVLPGFRTINLQDAHCKPIPPATLFVNIQIENILLSN